jgi:hypothetical protein
METHERLVNRETAPELSALDDSLAATLTGTTAIEGVLANLPPITLIFDVAEPLRPPLGSPEDDVKKRLELSTQRLEAVRKTPDEAQRFASGLYETVVSELEEANVTFVKEDEVKAPLGQNWSSVPHLNFSVLVLYDADDNPVAYTVQLLLHEKVRLHRDSEIVRVGPIWSSPRELGTVRSHQQLYPIVRDYFEKEVRALCNVIRQARTKN